ncbi:hypothetical protein AB0C76_28870 [Kitasatospora sp. NPDC048722]|uniref:hypothetical protein n=1 Tax=Kitasatospora sp. NPDC048722 TaxID=3155639 RepID=UPI0033CC10D2
MTGTDFLEPDRPDGPGGADTGEEQELRILLQQAAPHLPAPEDRIQRILARAARTRRRRRAAGLGAGLTGGLLAAVLAAAPAIAPSSPHAGPLGVAAAPAPAPSTAAPSPSSAPEGPDAVGPLGVAISFRTVSEMVVNVPKGWLTQENDWANPEVSIGTLANQPIADPTACADKETFCLPVGRLRSGGAVLTFRLVKDPTRVAEYVETSTPAEVTTLTKECAAVGGDAELIGHRTVTSTTSLSVIELDACLREPTTVVTQQVQQVLESIRSFERQSPTPEGPTG